MPLWLAITLGLIGGMASLGVMGGLILHALDTRMDEKIRLGPVRELEAKLTNGLVEEIREQGLKIDALTDELAGVKARLDTFIELWKQQA